MSLKWTLARLPVAGRLLLGAHRACTGATHLRRPVSAYVRWLFSSREITNFTYDLEAGNERYLAAFIADVTDTPYAVVAGHLREVSEDAALREHVVRTTMAGPSRCVADRAARYGRRIGWYALVRILKPRTVVETGVDKGLGACVLTAALMRNRAEGHEGRYFGTDIDPAAGWLLRGPYAEHGEILYGDSLASLRAFSRPIDLFINDSDHSADYEAEEYRTIAPKLSEQAVVLGDNAHCSDRLLTWSLETGRRFVYFQERPARHWYAGAGIGISFRRDRR